MRVRLYLALFWFAFAICILFVGYFLAMPIDILLFVIAILVAYIYGFVGLLFLALYLRDKIHGIDS